jgi:hypothetical protein
MQAAMLDSRYDWNVRPGFRQSRGCDLTIKIAVAGHRCSN